MRAKSVTEQARRAQIVAAAIEVLAEVGYGATSFKQIAARAGLSSTGLISYHFKGKQELVDSVYAEVRRKFAEFVLERLDRGEGPAAELRAFLRANLRFLRAHRAHMVALAQVRPHVSAADPADDDHREMADLLREGQRAGEFRAFDADTMAILVLALRNGVLARAADHPEVDLDLCERELVTAVELATTKE
ncbi:TetR family transcriptional regulator [Saccharothrix sp. S26]|uniref:TetR/AcrR family transcriptional regulator n=1 Tax=Saccharothrix sp. S26 TaxID=2907215 RepID=UPI001F323DDB|nr:TetR/AcrR family transcriptional regulator [Saccharothrix sp. S26]MCE6994291.1 TetR family transcriptional regulator [Saccharothrix sp. S26]